MTIRMIISNNKKVGRLKDTPVQLTNNGSTMKLSKMEIKYIENSTTETTTWQSSISIKLNFKKTTSISNGLTQKEATKNAIKKLINDRSVFNNIIKNVY